MTGKDEPWRMSRHERRVRDHERRSARRAAERAQAEAIVAAHAPHLTGKARESALMATLAILRGNKSAAVARQALTGTSAKPGKPVRLPAFYAKDRALEYGHVRPIIVDGEVIAGKAPVHHPKPSGRSSPPTAPMPTVEVIRIRRKRGAR